MQDPWTDGALTWWVTRPAEDAPRSVAQLVSRGIRAAECPFVERVDLPWPASLTPATDRGTVILLTSPFAVRRLAEQWLQWSDAMRAQCTCAALAPASSQVAERAGLPVVVSVKGGVEALARAVADQYPAGDVRLLHPTSDAALDEPEGARALALLACHDHFRGAVYATRPVAELPSVLLRTLREPYGLVFFAPSAVHAFEHAASAELPLPRAVVCAGASTSRAWQESRFASLVPARGASPASVGDAFALPESQPLHGPTP